MSNDAMQRAERAIQLVRKWLAEAQNQPASKSSIRLAGVLKDPNGLDFTVGFVDGVVRPESLRVAARNLRNLSAKVPRFLPLPMRAAVRAGGLVAPIAPAVVIPIARQVLRKMVSHLIVDASDARLGKSIRALKTEGVRLNVNLLGEAVLGEREAAKRLEGTKRLLARPDIDYVSIKVSSSVPPQSVWAFDDTVELISERLLPLYQLAASSPTPKFINLDMEEYRDLELTMAVFVRLLERPELHALEAGIVLQAYLPDALGAMVRLQTWAATRRENGGSAIKVRLVKGANLPMERVEAELHDWPLATWHTKQQSDTNYKRVLNYALTPERIANLHLGVAGHNLFDIAYAWLLAQDRGVVDGISFEMLLGMAQSQAAVVQREVGSLLLYTPVVHPAEFDVAIAYLIRRLEEGASSDNFMSAVFELHSSTELFEREKERFLASIRDLDEVIPAAHRVQNRLLGAVDALETAGFCNAADTDPAVLANQTWAANIRSGIASCQIGQATADSALVGSTAHLGEIIGSAEASSEGWRNLGSERRARILHRAGEVLESRRAQLIQVMASETGKTIDQGDPEVSEAIDFAHYYAESAKQLDQVQGASFEPVRVTAVIPPWNFPVAIPAGSTLAALAAGSAVIIKPASQARRSGAAMVEALWEAGVPRDVLQLVGLQDRSLGERLIADPRIGRVILTGGYETAELFRSFRRDVPILAETSGKNAIIVTPSADLDLAVKDVVYSAFGHAGQKCSAASLVILVGTAAKSRRFREQLADAVASLKVGYPTDALVRMGPIVSEAKGKLLDGLTKLGAGESWLIEPRQLDASGKLWSPGVREGVRPDSEFHKTEYFGPILGIMAADTLDEAIELVNATDYGLTSGIHSLDPIEVRRWIQSIEAGNLYVNRGTTGAVVQRQPFGGWKKSVVGAGTKAGGPNYLFALGTWHDSAPQSSSPLEPELEENLGLLADSALAHGLISEADREWLREAIALDGDAIGTVFRGDHDVTGLVAERNLLRYSPTSVIIRAGANAMMRDIVRVLCAGLRLDCFTLSVDPKHRGILEIINGDATTDAEWLAGLGAQNSDLANQRLRLIGMSASDVCLATDGRPDLAVFDGPVVRAGRVELLPFYREQAISITAHRFGNPNQLVNSVV